MRLPALVACDKGIRSVAARGVKQEGIDIL